MQIGTERLCLKLIKAAYDRPNANIRLNTKRPKIIPLKSGKEKNIHSLLFNMVL